MDLEFRTAWEWPLGSLPTVTMNEKEGRRKSEWRQKLIFFYRGGYVGARREAIDSNNVNLGFPLKCD